MSAGPDDVIATAMHAPVRYNVTGITAPRLRLIHQNPSDYLFNVLSVAFPVKTGRRRLGVTLMSAMFGDVSVMCHHCLVTLMTGVAGRLYWWCT